LATNISNEKDDRPLYQKTAEAVGEMLEEASPGTFLPSEPELAQQLGVSRSTLREALRLFEAQGMIIRRRGVGTYVAKPPQVIESGLEVLSSIDTLAAQIGLEIEARNLEITEKLTDSEAASWLGLPVGSPVIEIKRVIAANGRPVAYFYDCLPSEYLAPEEVDRGFSGSVLSLLLDRGTPALDRSQADITAMPADTQIAHSLGIHPGDVLLFLEARLLAQNGRVVDHSRSYFLPGTFKFHAVRHVNP
jgi:GntR family transcriptional regulator